MNLYAYVLNDPLNHTDPTGRSCTRNEDGRGMTCRVDDPGNLSRREVRQIERAYTRAVNRLLQNPDRTRTITVNGRSFNVRAGDRAQALTTAMVRGGTGANRAETRGGPLARDTTTGYPAEITINRNVTQRDWSGGTQNIERDIGKTFIHESFHLDPGEAAMRGNLVEGLFFNMRDFNPAHQTEYKDAASDLYNVPGLPGP